MSPGCSRCYALTMAKRLKAMGSAKYQRDGNPATSGPGFGLTVHPSVLELPMRWRKPRRIFVNSTSDLFHADVPDEFIAEVFGVMAATPRHTYQVLTKRHARMRSLLSRPRFAELVWNEAEARGGNPERWPLPNVWLGVSAENQQWADIRVPALLDTPAAVRFVSAEPLLGPVDLRNVAGIDALECDWFGGPGGGTGAPHPLLDWVIVGGESGPGARPMSVDWVRSLVDRCQYAGVSVFVKQMGAVWARSQGYAGDSKGGDPGYWPVDLRVREFPEVIR